MSTPANDQRGSARTWPWWLAAAALVLGVAIGAVVVGLLSEGSGNLPAATAQDQTSAVSSPTPTSDSASSVAASGQITVNQACLDAVTGAQDAYGVIDDIAEAARQLDASRLDEIVRSLQPMQAQLTEDFGACNVTATLPSQTITPVTEASAQPTPEASPSPTEPTG